MRVWGKELNFFSLFLFVKKKCFVEISRVKSFLPPLKNKEVLHPLYFIFCLSRFKLQYLQMNEGELNIQGMKLKH